MVAQKGADMLLKIGPSTPTPVTIAGSRSTSMRINNEMVEITNKDSAQRRELLAQAGTRSVQFQISGVYIDGASQDSFQVNIEADTIDAYSMFFGNGDTIDGTFQVTEYERTGEYNGEETFSATLESSGAVTFAP